MDRPIEMHLTILQTQVVSLLKSHVEMNRFNSVLMDLLISLAEDGELSVSKLGRLADINGKILDETSNYLDQIALDLKELGFDGLE